VFLRNAAAFCLYHLLFSGSGLFAGGAAGLFGGGLLCGSLGSGSSGLDRLRLHLFGLNRLSGLFLSLCRLLHGLFLHNGLFLDLRLCLLCRSALDHRCNLYNGLLYLLGRGTLCTILHLGNSPQLVIACGLLPDLQDGTIVGTHAHGIDALAAGPGRAQTDGTGGGSTVHI
jgi:hypothetical protein